MTLNTVRSTTGCRGAGLDRQVSCCWARVKYSAQLNCVQLKKVIAIIMQIYELGRSTDLPECTPPEVRKSMSLAGRRNCLSARLQKCESLLPRNCAVRRHRERNQICGYRGDKNCQSHTGKTRNIICRPSSFPITQKKLECDMSTENTDAKCPLSPAAGVGTTNRDW